MHFAKLKLKLAADNFVFNNSRKSMTKNTISVIVAISLAVIISILIAISIGASPGELIKQLFSEGFINWKNLIFNIVILGVGALAFSFTFRAGVFNIGIAGQMMAAGICILVISRALKDVYFPYGSGQVFMFFVAIIVGGFVASTVSLLKVYLHVNEVISSILLNWIIFFVVRLIIAKFYSQPNQLLSQSYDIPAQFQLVAPGIGGWLPALIVFLLLVIGMFIVFKYTTFGHKVISVGFSISGSKYAGYNVNSINIATMGVSGAIAGILGYILYTSGTNPNIPISSSVNALPIQGMNGIAIGLIAMSNPIAIIPVSFIIGLFESSAPYLSGLPSTFNEVILGFVILGAAMFVIFTVYKPWIWFLKLIYGFYTPKYHQEYDNTINSMISKYKAIIQERTLEYKKLLKEGRLISVDERNKISQSLYEEYIKEKSWTVAQYKKHLLVSRATLVFFPAVESKNIADFKNHEFEQQFIKVKTKKVNQIKSLEEKISSNKYSENDILKFKKKIEAIKASIEKNHSLLLHWEEKETKRALNIYSLKSRLSGSIDSQYKIFLSKAEKLKLDEKEKQVVIDWIQDAYKQAKEERAAAIFRGKN